jgi:hypothetical protein
MGAGAALETEDCVDIARRRPRGPRGLNCGFDAKGEGIADSARHARVSRPKDQICRTLYWIRYMFCCLIFEAHSVADKKQALPGLCTGYTRMYDLARKLLAQ